MFGIGIWELLIVLAIVVLLFGATRLPGVARALGRSLKEFKKGSDGDDGDDEGNKDKDEAKKDEKEQ